MARANSLPHLFPMAPSEPISSHSSFLYDLPSPPSTRMDASSNEQLSSQLEDEEEFCHLKRRFRTNFNDAQTALLERTFVNTHYPDQQTKREIAHRLGIASDRVTVWFQNRRSKWRRGHKNGTQQSVGKDKQQQEAKIIPQQSNKNRSSNTTTTLMAFESGTMEKAYCWTQQPPNPNDQPKWPQPPSFVPAPNQYQQMAMPDFWDQQGGGGWTGTMMMMENTNGFGHYMA